ncbi:MAG: PhnD/SsuA/transferrin family substrate-binding protein, partial [Gammaproteobacteria bacterium]|nr:PhnD/SsuA/transferrin family substrate-binding protein [Gammaproteobacteria bacterium]
MKNNTSIPNQYRKQSLDLKRHPLLFSAAWILVIIILTGCDSNKVEEIDLSDRIDDVELAKMTHNHDSNCLHFGFDLRGSPEEDARQYLPFIKYLEAATGLHFDLRFTPKSRAIADELGTGQIQLAAIGAGSYIQAHTQYD